VSRLYIAVAVVTNTTTHGLSHCSQACLLPLGDCKLQRHMDVNNLPEVVTRQCSGRELNSQPLSCESSAVTTRLPSVHGSRVICDAVVLAGVGSTGRSVVPAWRWWLLCTDSAFSATGPSWRLLCTSAADESLVSLVTADASTTHDGQFRSVSSSRLFLLSLFCHWCHRKLTGCQLNLLDGTAQQ